MEGVDLTDEPSAAERSRSALDRQLLDGMAWTAILRWSAQVVSWVGTAIAARLLSPDDYGLIGMAMVGIGLVRMVEDFGMDAVLVQDRTIGGARQARLAGLVLMMGIAFALAFVALSVPIARFFKEPQVAMLVSVLGSLCIADALQVIPRAVLQREMEFRRLALLQLVQVAATQTILIAGAWLGWGVWSLVFNSLGGALAVTLLLLWWRPFRISWPRDIASLSVPLLQGWRILASRFAWYAYTAADQTVIGRVLGKGALGTYSFAMTFSTTISQEISSVLSRVVPGVFSTVQHLQLELRRYFMVLTELLCYLALPVSFGMAVTADLIVQMVLGPQWGAVVAPLRILCIYSAFYSCQVLVGHLLLWTGRFRANMWCSILAASIMPLGFWLGSRWGLAGVAWVWVIGFPLVNLPAFVIGFRAIGINGWQWLYVFLPALLACLVMMAAVVGVRSVLPADMAAPIALAICVPIGVLAYIATLLLFFRSRLAAVWSFVRVLRSRGRGLVGDAASA
ncbi:MAG TPA: lipopolysaccharide biosynthesis protein [Steroidobacteraceae bacterium]|nr:lipopolysaccharide biosynthesis protein [Steroidobacteraceae bacterium]